MDDLSVAGTGIDLDALTACLAGEVEAETGCVELRESLLGSMDSTFVVSEVFNSCSSFSNAASGNSKGI